MSHFFKKSKFLALFATSMHLQAQITTPQDAPVLPSARPEALKSHNVFLELDFLYWKANETGLSYAMNQVSFNEKNPEMLSIGSVANPKFDWETGFRIGLGYNMPYDEWDLSVLWTWNEGKAQDSQSSRDQTPTIYPSYIHPNAFNDESIFSCLNANNNLLIHLNMIDLDLGKQFKTGKWLSLRPHMGLRTVWLDQAYDVKYENLYAYNLEKKELNPVLDEYLTHMINNFWGIGIQGGVDSQWRIKGDISLFGNLTTALLYGIFDTSYTENYLLKDIAEGVTLSEENKFHAGRAILDLQLGLRWSASFFKEKIRFLIQGGWEHHAFFSQNQFMRFVDGQNWGNFTQNQGDVYFHGWTGTARIYF